MRRTLPIRHTVCWLASVASLWGQATEAVERELAVPRSIARWMRADFREQDDRRRRLEADLAAGLPTPQNEQSARIGWKIFGYGEAMPVRQWVEVDLGETHPVDGVALVPVDEPTAGNSGVGFGFPGRFRVELEDDSGSVVVIADYTAADFPNPATLPVFLPAHGTPARRVRVIMTKPWANRALFAYALGEIMVLRGNRNLATGLSGVTVRTSGSLESPPGWSREHLVDGQSTVGAPLRKSEKRSGHGWESARSLTASVPAWAQVDLGATTPIEEVRLVPARLHQHSARHGYGFPLRFRIELADEPEFKEPRVLIDRTDQPVHNPAFNPATVPGGGLLARFVRVTATELWARSESHYVFALAEMQVYSGGLNVAAGAAVATSGSDVERAANWSPAFLTDGLRGNMDLVEWPEWLHALSRRREILHELDLTRVALDAMQPRLVRTATWVLATGVALSIFAGLAALYRARLAQAGALAALQRRIASDLHDEIGSNLASIAMLTELGQRLPDGIAASDVEEIRRLAHESSAAMRDIVWLIQPGPHDASRLAERLRATARQLVGTLQWQFEVTGLDGVPSLDAQRHLLLALKEMLHNVLRHADARCVEIQLKAVDGRFALEVRDNGRGFDPDRKGDGHGFASLRHRAELLGGTLEIDSRPGHGTRVRLIGMLHPSIRPHARST